MLHQISLPGTHHSATRGLGLSSQCQHTTIPEQLYIGVRYFDIRIDSWTPADPPVVHGSKPTGLTLSQVAKMFADFLTGANGLTTTRETVVVQVKVDTGPDDDAHTSGVVPLFEAAFAQAPGQLFLKPIRMGGTIPTLADLRGRLVLLRRYVTADQNSAKSCTPVKYFVTGSVYNQWSANHRGETWEQVFDKNQFEWPDKGASLDDYRNLHGLSFVIQDKYMTPLHAKFGWITEFLEAARDGKKPDSWYLNFSSSAFGSPVSEADTINPWLLDWLRTAPARPAGHGYGTLLMDFATSELVRSFASKNI